jgi:hypothetical protein
MAARGLLMDILKQAIKGLKQEICIPWDLSDIRELIDFRIGLENTGFPGPWTGDKTGLELVLRRIILR